MSRLDSKKRANPPASASHAYPCKKPRAALAASPVFRSLRSRLGLHRIDRVPAQASSLTQQLPRSHRIRVAKPSRSLRGGNVPQVEFPPSAPWRVVAVRGIRALLLITAVCSASIALGAVIYKWVDEQGVTHVSDKVPERYKDSAKRIDSRAYEVSDADKRAAAALAARTLQSAATLPQVQPASAPSDTAAPSPERRPSSASTARPGSPADCAASWRAFYDAQACFDKGPKSGGFVNPARNPGCPVILDPSPRCGPPVLSPQDRAADKPVYPTGDENRWSTR